MIDGAKLKILIYSELEKILDEKIREAEYAIASAIESRNNDTKSSAGDKYETGRAMMQMEIEHSEMQLRKTLEQKAELLKIDLHHQFTKCFTGSLVITDNGNYFISIGLGRIIAADNNYYSISLASPIGIALNGKSAGDTFIFQGKEIKIKSVC